MGDLARILQTVHLASDDAHHACNSCWQPLDKNLDQRVNHYTQQHGWTLLHVGQETARDYEGAPWHRSVALLGATAEQVARIAPKPPPATIQIHLGEAPGSEK